jgi:hypothetical protein
MDAIAVLESVLYHKRRFAFPSKRSRAKKTSVLEEGPYMRQRGDEPSTALISSSLDSQSLRQDISVEEGIAAVRQAVRAGIMGDLGSGSHVDMCVITESGVNSWRETMESPWDSESSNRNTEFLKSMPSAEIGGNSPGRMLSNCDSEEMITLSINGIDVEAGILDADNNLPVSINVV